MILTHPARTSASPSRDSRRASVFLGLAAVGRAALAVSSSLADLSAPTAGFASLMAVLDLVRLGRSAVRLWRALTSKRQLENRDDGAASVHRVNDHDHPQTGASLIIPATCGTTPWWILLHLPYESQTGRGVVPPCPGRRQRPAMNHPRRAVRVYAPADRPSCEVLVDGAWFYGEVCQWSLDDAGGWWAHVKWTRRPGETYLDSFPADRIRELPEPDQPRRPPPFTR